MTVPERGAPKVRLGRPRIEGVVGGAAQSRSHRYGRRHTQLTHRNDDQIGEIDRWDLFCRRCVLY